MVGHLKQAGYSFRDLRSPAPNRERESGSPSSTRMERERRNPPPLFCCLVRLKRRISEADRMGLHASSTTH